MTTDASQWLWEWTEGRRHSPMGRTSFKDAVEAASREGVPLDWRAVHYLESLSDARHEFQLTASLLGFVRAYLAGRSVGTVVDPAMTAVAPLMAVVEGIAERGVGFAPSEHVRERARYLGESALIETRQGWFVPPSPPDECELGSPDLIFSAPPAGMKREAVTYSGGHGSVEVRDAAGLHALLTARELAADGEALFLVPDGFLFRGGPHSVRQQLGAFGLHVQSCVQVVGEVRGTGINFNLLALRKQPVDAVWIGQFSPHVDTDQLAANLRDRSTGRTPEQGRLVDWEQFSGFDRLKASEDAERLAKRTGRELVVLGDLLDGDPVWPKAGVKDLVEPQPGVVYLPTFPTADARAGTAASELKVAGCVALPIDPKRATPRYVAEVLNSPVGRAARQAASSGSVIRSLRRGETLEMVLPLPDMAEQRRATAFQDKIADGARRLACLPRKR